MYIPVYMLQRFIAGFDINFDKWQHMIQYFFILKQANYNQNLDGADIYDLKQLTRQRFIT